MSRLTITQFSIGSLSSVLVGLLPGGNATSTALGMMAGILGMALADVMRRYAPPIGAEED